MIPTTHYEPPIQRPPRQKLSLSKWTLLILSVLSGLMLGLAIPNLVTGDGTTIAVKSALLSVGGVTVSYAINRLALERGAPLATVGYWPAGIVSVLTVATVGIGLFSATYAGLVFRDVEQLAFERHGEALSVFVADSASAAAQASRIAPAMSVIVSDLEQKLACEIAESCVSGRGAGGFGPTARLLQEKVGRAQALAVQVESGEKERDESLRTISALYTEYQSVAGATDLGTAEKRQAMQSIDLNIKQAASGLKEAMPVSLLLAYADELKAGADIADSQEASARINAILAQHGHALSGLVASIPAQTQESPAFPKTTGVTDTFVYIGHFLPVAGIAAVVELIFPITLWLYTFFALSRASNRVSPPQPSLPDPDEEAFRRLISHPGFMEEPRISRTTAPGAKGRNPRGLNGRGNTNLSHTRTHLND